MISSKLNKFGVPSPTGGSVVMSQPKPKNRFRVITYGFGSDSSWGNAGGWMCFGTNAVDRPKFSVDTHELHKFDSITRYTGKTRWNDITLTIKDTVDNKPALAIHSQLQKQKDYYRRMAPRLAGYDYKFEMMIQTLNGQFNIEDEITVAAELIDKYLLGNKSESISPKLLAGTLETWLCTGCIVTDYDFGSYNYADSNFNEIVLTIAIDNCILMDKGGGIMLQSSTFDSGSIFGGIMGYADSAIGSMLGLSGPVTKVIGDTVKSGINGAASSVFKSVKGLF